MNTIKSYAAAIVCSLLVPIAGNGQITIQVNQAIGVQKDNARKFVAGKATAVRAFLPEETTIDATTTEAVVKRNGETVATLTPNQTSGAVRVVDFLCSSFEACGNWAAGSYSFTVKVNGTEASTNDPYEFVQRSNMRILAVPVTANYGGTVVPVTDSRWKGFADYVRGTYPVPAAGLIWTTREDFDASASKYDLETDDGQRELWEALTKLIPSECSANPDVDGCYHQVFGFIMARPKGYPNGSLQGYTFGKPANIGVITDEDAPATVAHEIGHTYGLGDTYDGGSYACKVNPAPDSFSGKDFDDPDKKISCQEGRQPLEGVGGTLVPAEHHPYEVGGRGALGASAEYMGSGGRQAQFWTSRDAYDHLFDKLAPKASKQRIVHAVPQRYIQCFGTIRKNATAAGDVQMDPCYTFFEDDDIPSTTGTYMIAALNAAGQRLASANLEPNFNPVGPKGLESTPLAVAPFIAELPYPEGTVRFQVLRAGSVVREYTISASAPLLSNVAPQAVGTLDGKVTITWDASDADRDALTYVVEFNGDTSDEDSEWEVIAVDLTQSRLEVDFGDLPGGTQSKFRVTASDGFNSSEAESRPFAVAPKRPDVVIKPLRSPVVLKGSDIFLDGDAYDLQDESIDERSFVWTSSISGTLGRGRELKVRNLPVGAHRITLSVTNSDGLTGTASTSVSIVDGSSQRRRPQRGSR